MTERGRAAVASVRQIQREAQGTAYICVPSDIADDLISEYEIIDGMALRLERSVHDSTKILEQVAKLYDEAE